MFVADTSDVHRSTQEIHPSLLTTHSPSSFRTIFSSEFEQYSDDDRPWFRNGREYICTPRCPGRCTGRIECCWGCGWGCGTDWSGGQKSTCCRRTWRWLQVCHHVNRAGKSGRQPSDPTGSRTGRITRQSTSSGRRRSASSVSP